jgi:AhpD family alkylhydroperoxidase
MQGSTIMFNDWPQHAKSLSPPLADLRSGTADVMKAFSAIAASAKKAGALDMKTKELIALAISVATRCDDCIAFHAKAAVDHGASREEMMETLGMAIYMGAGPSVMYAAHAAEAFNQFAAAKEAAKEPASG